MKFDEREDGFTLKHLEDREWTELEFYDHFRFQYEQIDRVKFFSNKFIKGYRDYDFVFVGQSRYSRPEPNFY